MNKDVESRNLLEVQDLSVSFLLPGREVRAVNGISYSIKKGESMGLVGESGSGKSVEAYAVLGLLKPPAKIHRGNIRYEGKDILCLSKKEWESFHGNEISMIFQNPIASLDPVFPIGKQMEETIRDHDKSISRLSARRRSIEMLREVRIRNPEQVMKQYPYELSGGMCQRIMIAIALLCKPKLLIADEPTTNLDVTIQSQVIQILKQLQRQSGMALLYITHNFGIVAELCDSVSVMCGGYILEQGQVEDIFYRAAHPYTKMLLQSIPHIDAFEEESSLFVDESPANPVLFSDGCVFFPRCPFSVSQCSHRMPSATSLSLDHWARCWLLAQDGETGRKHYA